MDLSKRALWARSALVLVVGVAAFVVTASVRAGHDSDGGDIAGNEDRLETPLTEASTETATDATGGPTPLVVELVEVPMRILAPIDSTDLPVDDGSNEGIEVQTSVVDVLSPVVGVAMVPSGGGSTAESWSPAPPEFAEQLGLLPAVPVAADVGSDGAEPSAPGTDQPDIDEAEPEPIDIGEDALDEVVRRAAEYQNQGPDPDPTSGNGAEPEPSVFPEDPVVVLDGEAGFVDPCTRENGEEGTGEACPNPGEPATVRESFALEVPPPLSITVTSSPTGECAADVDDDELRIAIESTTPIAAMSFRFFWVRLPGVQTNLEVVTPDDTAADWLAAFAEATDAPPPPIQHCLTLTDLRGQAGVGYRYKVDARDVFDQTWHVGRYPPGPLYLSGPLRIPSTAIWPLNDNEVLVSAAHRVDEGIRMNFFRRTGDVDIAVDPCARESSGSLAGWERERTAPELVRTESDADAMSAAGFDSRYRYRTAGAMRLAEGSTYRLCVNWSVSGPSFSAGVTRTEGYDLVTPDGLDTSFSLVDVDLDGADRSVLDPGDLSVTVRPGGRATLVGSSAPCGSWTNSEVIEASASLDRSICDVDPRRSALYERSAIVEIETRDGDGVVSASRHVVRMRSCTGLCVPPESDDYRIEIPGAPERDFWCGGLGNACDRPTDGSRGAVTIRVDYGNATGSTNSRWSVSDPTDIGDSRPPPPEAPQLDVWQTPSTSGTWRSKIVTVPVVVDRPVDIEVALQTVDGGVPCVRDGASTTAVTVRPTTDRTFDFEGLCPGQDLFPLVTLTDSDGNSSSWHGAPGSSWLPPDVQLWQRGVVPRWTAHWDYEAALEIIAPTSHYRIRALGVSLNGSLATGGFWGPVRPSIGNPGCNVVVGPIETRRLPPGGQRTLTASSVDEVRFTVVVDIELLVTSPCQPASDEFATRGPEVLQLSVPAEDIVIGQPYVLAASISVPGLSDPDATLDITGTFTITGES